jgi:hypothetical protein
MNYLVIPDGIRADSNGEPISEPSFVFKQVLDYLVKIANAKDTIFIAPANNFGGNEYEHELAYRYLIESLSTEPPNIKYPIMKTKRNLRFGARKYIDTAGNAFFLKDYLGSAIHRLSFDLVCSKIHSYRAEYCFKKLGYKINRVHRVDYEILCEKIVTRLWYYKYKPIHILYEVLAVIRDCVTIPIRFHSH